MFWFFISVQILWWNGKQKRLSENYKLVKREKIAKIFSINLKILFKTILKNRLVLTLINNVKDFFLILWPPQNIWTLIHFAKNVKKRQNFVQISVFCSITALNLGRGSSFSQTRFVKPATTKKVDFLTRGPPWYIGSLALWISLMRFSLMRNFKKFQKYLPLCCKFSMSEGIRYELNT